MTRFVVQEGEPVRVDRNLAQRFPHVSRTQWQKIFSDGQVYLDGRRAKKGERCRAGQEISLRVELDSGGYRVIPEDKELDLLFADSDILVFNKRAGIPCQPLAVSETGTIANRLVHHYPETIAIADDHREAGLVHRLDRHTSGALLVARTRETWKQLRAAFGQGEVKKSYLALVAGACSAGSCSEGLLQKGKRVVVSDDGLRAHTSWEPVQSGPSATLLRCECSTGRMHQVRAHLAHSGSPILGDQLYGPEGTPETGEGFFLHASELQLTHPKSGMPLQVQAPLPRDRQEWLRRALGPSAET